MSEGTKTTDGITFGQGMRLENGRIEVSGCKSLEEAQLKVLSCAVATGYKRPTKWQKFWGATDYFEMFNLTEKDLIQ